MGEEAETEQQLVAAARRGDTEALLSLVVRHERAVYGLGMRLLGDRDLAEEVLQETFARALAGLRSFRGDAAFGSWLYRIAANVAGDLIRKRARQRLHESPLDPSLDDDESSTSWEERWRDPSYRVDPEAVTLRLERLEWLDAALDRLPEAQRMTVLLHDALGLKVTEIASATGVPLPTAKARLRRGRMALVTIVDDMGYEERTRNGVAGEEMEQ
ncbi:MAG TPA: sigma-70 family RNA polymerase sigma factor [Chloroflexia bacterium]|nr:sigma-70 family RNA polymerase sigma factor [Chloroflexia bacterium]